MGKLSTFKIVFSRNKDRYISGDLVEGHVAIEIKDGIKVKGIYLECVGEASVGWSESQATHTDKTRRNHARYYKANESYFKYERELMKRCSDRRGSISVNEGSYMYPFAFRLPPNIPSSFEGPLGHVRYWVTGTVEKNWGSDHVSRVDLTVTNPLDLNKEKDAVVSQTDSAETTLCCLCCQSGPITCVFSLERAGYVPGDSIRILGEIVNKSNRKISSTSARLIMHTEYNAESKSKSHVECIAEVKRESIRPGGRDRWEGADVLIVPKTPVTYLSGCSLINVSYWVELVVHPAGPALNLKVPLKVIIGSVPLRGPDDPAPGPSGMSHIRSPHLSHLVLAPRKSLPSTGFSHREHVLPNVPETSEEKAAATPDSHGDTGDSMAGNFNYLNSKENVVQGNFSSNSAPSQSSILATPTNPPIPDGATGSSSCAIPYDRPGQIPRYGRSRRRVSSHQ